MKIDKESIWESIKNPFNWFHLLVSLFLAVAAYFILSCRFSGPWSAIIVGIIDGQIISFIIFMAVMGLYGKEEHPYVPDRTFCLPIALFLIVATVCAFGSLYVQNKHVEFVASTTLPPSDKTLKDPVDAAYFSAVTLTTLGYGDYVPAERTSRWLVLWELGTGGLLLLGVLPLLISRLADLSRLSVKARDLTHIHAFTAAMQRKDLEAMLTHMADDVVLNTPLAAEPLKGKTAIRPVVGALLGVVDQFDFKEIMEGPKHVSSFFKLTVGSIELDGMDYWLLNDAGLIKEMSVLWRPLPAAVAVQKKLAAIIT